MTLLRDDDYPNGSWRNKNGRPLGSGTAQFAVATYRAQHPEASVTEVARALEISRTTVYKWWDGETVPAPAKPKKVKQTPQPAALDSITPEQVEDFAAKLVGSILALSPEERKWLLDELAKGK